jgi:hypothetical protein
MTDARICGRALGSMGHTSDDDGHGERHGEADVGDDSVEVSPEDLLDWGRNITTDVISQQLGVTNAYTGISNNSKAAFLSDLSNGTFAEGQTAFNVIIRNMKEFQSFLKDVTTGVQAIQSASTAMAVAYMTTDGDAANNINAVDFAFADGGKAPAGFPTGKGVSTLADQAQANDDAAGRYTEAGLAAQSLASGGKAADALAGAKGQMVDGVMVYTFPDGSSLHVATGGVNNSYISTNNTSYSVYKQGDKKPATTLTTGSSYYAPGDSKTTSTATTTTTADGQQISSSEQTTTTHLADGTTQVTVITDAGGKSTSQTTTVAPPTDTSQTDQGAIAQLEQKYGSQGNTKYANT